MHFPLIKTYPKGQAILSSLVSSYPPPGYGGSCKSSWYLSSGFGTSNSSSSSSSSSSSTGTQFPFLKVKPRGQIVSIFLISITHCLPLKMYPLGQLGFIFFLRHLPCCLTKPLGHSFFLYIYNHH